MPDTSDADKIAGAERGEVSAELWSAEHNIPIHILSLAARNVHVVVTLKDASTIAAMRQFIVAHRRETAAEWFEIGSFSGAPVTFYSARGNFSLICDGRTVAGFPESFGISFSDSLLDCFYHVLGDILEATSHGSPET